MDWDSIKHAFVWDGSLRDLYVENADIALWEWFYVYLRDSSHTLEFFLDGNSFPSPKTASEVFNLTKTTHANLLINLGSFDVACHFFDPTEIEMDVDPRDFRSDMDIKTLLRFMTDLAMTLKKRVILTGENNKEELIFETSGENCAVE